MKFLRSVNKSILSDAELISEYRNNGGRHVLSILFDRYTHLVFGVCMKYLKDEDGSKDATMQVFEKLMEDIGRHEINHFKSWLYTVTKNHCLMILRKQQAEEVKNNEPLVVEMHTFSHHDSELKEEQLSRLEQGVANLVQEQRTCIELFYLQGKCYQEVAESTGYSMNEVKSYIQNGKRNLKNYLLGIHEK